MKKMDRRSFLATSALGATAFGLASRKISADPAQAQRVESANNRITVGMIAVGARAVDLIDSINNCKGTEIVAVCDAYQGRVERALERIGGHVKAYKDYQEIIGRKEIDAVVISSPDHLHARQMIDAMDAGKHVYIEKPLTYTVDEGIEIIKAAKRNKVAVQVGSSGVSSPLSAKAKEIVASGRLGQITMIRAYNNRNSMEGAWIYPIPPDASKKTVDWGMFLGSAPKRPFNLERFFRWRCYKDYSGGIPTDLFVHLCNSIHYIMGVEMCKSAIAMGGLYRWKASRDVADTINASLEYPQGFMVNITSTFNNQKGSGSSLSIHGTEGTLEFTGGQLVFTPEIVQDNHGWVVRSWPSKLEKEYYDDPENKFREQPWTRPPKALLDGEIYASEGIDATTVHFQEFFNAVRSGTPTKEDAAVGHHSAACAHMVNLSIDQGKMIYWDKERDTVKV
jgi:predicted dehydrogenase